MPLYRYMGLTEKGKRTKGTIEAADLPSAKLLLREQEVILTQISEEGKHRKERPLSQEQLLDVTLQLSQLVGAGLPLYESLLVIEEQSRKERYHRLTVSLCERVKGGARLSEAMGLHPTTFSLLYRSMVAAGESSGSLDVVLGRLVDLLKRQQKLRRELVTALIYPSILACFALAVISLLLGFVIPSLEEVFVGRTLNGFTSSVIATSHLFRRCWWAIPLVLGGLTALLYRLWSPEMARRVDSWLLRLPLIGTLMLYASLARFCRTLSTLQGGGVPLIDSMRIAVSVLDNGELEALFSRVEEGVIGGSSLSAELAVSDMIPTLMTRMLAVGEEAGNAVEMAAKLATIYEEEVEKRVNRLLALLQPIILLVMGLVVGVILLAVLLPLTDVSSMGF